MKIEEKIVAKSEEQMAGNRAFGCRGSRTAIMQVRIGIRTTLEKEIQQFTIINNSPSIPPAGGIREPLAGNSDLPVISYQLIFKQ